MCSRSVVLLFSQNIDTTPPSLGDEVYHRSLQMALKRGSSQFFLTVGMCWSLIHSLDVELRSPSLLPVCARMSSSCSLYFLTRVAEISLESRVFPAPVNK